MFDVIKLNNACNYRSYGVISLSYDEPPTHTHTHTSTLWIICYNDFYHSFIPVPPQKPKILNERGEIIQALAGPYDEGSDMVLLCEVRGGLPPPKIQWLWNGKSIDSTMLDFSFAGSQTSKLVIKNLSRIHQHSIVTCRASNFPKTETTANVTIDLLCKSHQFISFLQ